MATDTSNRVWFIQAARNEKYTIKGIQEKFGVAYNTARSWTKLPEIMQVPGSYPYLFTHKDNASIPTSTADSIDLSKYVEVDMSAEEANRALEAMQSNTAIGAESFRAQLFAVDSPDKAFQLEKRLIAYIAVTRKYAETIKD